MIGAKEVTVLVVFFFHMCNPASLHPLGRTLPTVHLQANTENKGQQEGLNNAKSGGNVIPQQRSKIGHAFGGRGGTAGEMPGAGGDGNGGGSHSTYPQGGAAVIPIYAASAHHNNHHSAGSCIHFSIGISTLTAILLACLLLINPFEF